jgi:diguanylate cyclase (GGDEF)-like protein
VHDRGRDGQEAERAADLAAGQFRHADPAAEPPHVPRPARARHAQEPARQARIAILFIDLDHFKEVNDTLGHQQGDVLLVDAARRISACVRKSDTVARLGGDEFTVILSELNESETWSASPRTSSTACCSRSSWAEQAFVSASIGITLYPDDALDIDSLLKHADQAMYAAKGAGRNRYSYFTPTLQVAALTACA